MLKAPRCPIFLADVAPFTGELVLYLIAASSSTLDQAIVAALAQTNWP